MTEKQLSISGVPISQVDSVAGTYTYASGAIKLDLPTGPTAGVERTSATLKHDGDEITLDGVTRGSISSTSSCGNASDTEVSGSVGNAADAGLHGGHSEVHQQPEAQGQNL